jgi:hypothetical protein
VEGSLQQGEELIRYGVAPPVRQLGVWNV